MISILTKRRRPTIWINDAWAADEILVKRAGVYSSRPRMLMFAELGVGQANILHTQTYTQRQRERFRNLRKITHQGVGIQQVHRNGKDDQDVRLTLSRCKGIAVSKMMRIKPSCTNFLLVQTTTLSILNAMLQA